MTDKKRVAVLIGSTRPTRICAGIAAWARDALQEQSDLDYDLLDLAEVALPFLDEPCQAALRQYELEHTRSWSRLVQSYHGFFFVFPQYNWGYPGVLKNALDYLYWEWRDRPASLLTYGTHGGSKGAEQLIGVLRGLHMRLLDTHVEAVITERDVDENRQLRDLDATLHPNRKLLRTIGAEMSRALDSNP
ncbi:NADPH-dependent FMN reductase [Nocardia pseudobrasiliensis]|uniref:NAD(P)H-dependent FMN reductase n=1 Tax=Nocardia pseudobrasiliensis TaxID=45979 RepID=A0A370IFB2_9NOCA|nr:NADPH-dependent FMN reductase [Nocardia pseudobrasiliensis]RDI69290.1 NAD(P)H-dependent FMN reductase [Nocardia pseudobrasiliensis]